MFFLVCFVCVLFVRPPRPTCLNTTAGCRPEGLTLDLAAAYHRSVGLAVGVYHVDPYWSVSIVGASVGERSPTDERDESKSG